jgi:hypothetical protein
MITEEEHDKLKKEYYDMWESYYPEPYDKRHKELFPLFPELFDKEGKEISYEFNNEIHI